ncbi:MAG: hypothetical protein ACP5P4_09910 [Steroidobacteraceae bacterium]
MPWFLVGLACVGSSAAWASTRPPPRWAAALLACRRVSHDAARLACFDRQSAALAGMLAKGAALRPADHPAAPVASAAGAPPDLSPSRTFGLAPAQIAAREAAVAKLPRQLKHIVSRIVVLQRTADDRDIFTLANHQVWAQLNAGGGLFARVGDVVTISRGWLGSYLLSLPSRRSCKVTRIR